MKKLRISLVRALPILLAGFLPAGLAAQTIVLTDVNIIDGNGGPVQEGMTIVIEGQRITSITEGAYEATDGADAADVHDLDGAWVLPGFWNMHVHLSVMFPHNHALDDELAPSKVIRAGLNAIDGLRHGFTSIRSVGEQDYIDVAWGLAFDQGFFLGPRVFGSGEPVSPTAGHRGSVAEGADGVAAIRKEVRKRVQNGARVIKLFSVEMLPDELEAAVETADNLGVHVTSHVREPGAYAAVAAGVDCLEHGYGLTDETIELMAEKGTFYDPTIICNLSAEYIAEREARLAELGYAEDEEIVRLRTMVAFADERSPEFAREQREILTKANKAGVKLLIGSDSMPVGEMGFLEMEQFVISGVSEMDTIIAATRNGAEMQGVLDDLGTVEEGKLADLVVLGANPLENISNIRETVMVLKGGVVVDLDAQLGTSTYWDYYGSMELPEGFLAESEEAAGFQRGNTATDG